MKIINFIVKFLMIFNLSFNLFCAVAVSNDKLSPKTSLSSVVIPREISVLDKFYGDEEGIINIINLLKSSSLAKVLIDQTLNMKNIKVGYYSFRHFEEGLFNLVIDVYSTQKSVNKRIDSIIHDDLEGREIGYVTGINERAIGRLLVLFPKIDGYITPIIWEVQPSASWKRLYLKLAKEISDRSILKEKYPEIEWKKEITRAFAHFCSFYGFKDIYARSAKSMKQEDNYALYVPNSKENKVVLSPEDVKVNYRQPFSNLDLWKTPKVVFIEHGVQTFKNERYQNSERSFPLHKYSHIDRLLYEKGINNYYFKEIKNRKGEPTLVLVLDNKAENLAFTWRLNSIINGMKNKRFPKKVYDTSILSRWLRFKIGIRMFQKPVPLRELTKDSLTFISA